MRTYIIVYLELSEDCQLTEGCREIRADSVSSALIAFMQSRGYEIPEMAKNLFEAESEDAMITYVYSATGASICYMAETSETIYKNGILTLQQDSEPNKEWGSKGFDRD